MNKHPADRAARSEIPTIERYAQAFQLWRFASEVRFKILAAWWAVYVGLAVVFAWVWDNPPFSQFAFVVPFIGLVATGLFWTMDVRNGGAIYGSKEVIKAIDTAEKIPAEHRIVEKSEYGFVKHATAIMLFALIMGAILLSAMIYLLCNRG